MVLREPRKPTLTVQFDECSDRRACRISGEHRGRGIQFRLGWVHPGRLPGGGHLGFFSQDFKSIKHGTIRRKLESLPRGHQLDGAMPLQEEGTHAELEVKS